MQLFKPDFYRFFALGFAAGAVLVLGVHSLPDASDLAATVVPTAQAASAR